MNGMNGVAVLIIGIVILVVAYLTYGRWLAKHQMETVGAELRKNMIWGNDDDPDTASN